MAFLSRDEQHTLALICETLAPQLLVGEGEDRDFFGVSAADVGLAAHVEQGLEIAADASEKAQLRLILNSLEKAWFNRAVANVPKRFSAMTHAERETVLQAWAFSKMALLRKAFQTFKRLSLFLFYSVTDANGTNPTWQAIDYAPPPLPHAKEKPQTPDITPLEIHADQNLVCDVLVIGSGAGGGVVAGELASVGFDVLIVEKGAYRSDAEFIPREVDALQTLYEKQGLLTTRDASMLILAGSTLGGGTTINWSASFRTPDAVLYEWSRNYGFHEAESAAFSTSLDAVLARLNVNTDESVNNQQNELLEKGAEKLGYDIAPIPRNVAHCADENGEMRCGFCNFGCSHGAKQGTVKTYLRDAVAHGARVIVNAEVARLRVVRGVAEGAEMHVRAGDSEYRVNVKAKIVVVAAGAIHTPALLMRSGVEGMHIGANLHLHPTVPIYGVFDHAVEGWKGAPMTRISREFADLDGDGYGVRLEVAPAHPGIGALATGWESARQHRRVLSNLKNMSNIIAITRDKFSGRVSMGKDGQPRVDYRLHPYDARHLMRGMIESLRILEAAGALELASSHAKRLVYYPQGGKRAPYPAENTYGSFEAYLKAVEAEGLRSNTFALFSAHQMSSCRIAGDSGRGALSPTGETYAVKNLYVADASALPTASGVNPMITIMGTAHYIAQQIKSRYNT